ncbi:carbon-nitrogen hydrolase family protein [Aneurinibacillus sp. REN35]|uniref:carbon-nitrogen hydrolase family protein n=1 Tax=Aneurinibacillus sp. REN35 TaxID=3237286 RepID=UPI003526D522
MTTNQMMIKVAAVQTNPRIADAAYNLAQSITFIREAAGQGAKVIVFPECALTGYCFESREDAEQAALHANGEWVEKLTKEARDADAYIVTGFIEKRNEKLYNSLAIIGPEGLIKIYTKAHLPQLGVDNFVEPGCDPFIPVDTAVGKLGVLICYDIRFPEQARALALQGADILIHITNLPLTASSQLDYLLPARANENHVHIISSDRVGEERGFVFLGRSTIYDVDGAIISQANDTDEMIIYAELDLTQSREKSVYYPPAEGKPVAHTNSLFAARRKELYGVLSQ